MSRLEDNARGLAQRKERMAAHAKAGLTLAQACDREGCDENSAAAYAKELGFKFRKPTPGEYSPPHAADFGDALRVHDALARFVEEFRKGKTDYDVGKVLGLTRMELSRASTSGKPRHGWTLAQMQRLADAYDRPLGNLLDEVTINCKRSDKPHVFTR